MEEVNTGCSQRRGVWNGSHSGNLKGMTACTANGQSGMQLWKR